MWGFSLRVYSPLAWGLGAWGFWLSIARHALRWELGRSRAICHLEDYLKGPRARKYAAETAMSALLFEVVCSVLFPFLVHARS